MDPGLSGLNRLRTSPALSEHWLPKAHFSSNSTGRRPSPWTHGGTSRSSKQAREPEARRRRERPRRGRTPPRGLRESGFRLRRDGEEWEAGASGCASPSLALPRRARGLLPVSSRSGKPPSPRSPIYRAFVLLTLISIRDERQCECTSPWFTSSIRCVCFVWILCGVVVLNSDQFMGELRPNVQFSSSIANW